MSAAKIPKLIAFVTQDLPFKSKGFVLVGLPQLISLIILCGLYLCLTQAEQSAQRQARSKQIATLINRLSMATSVVVSMMSAYAVTYRPAYLEKYTVARNEIELDYKELVHLEAGNAEHLEDLKHIQTLYTSLFQLLTYVKEASESGQDRPALFHLISVRSVFESLVKELTDKTRLLSEKSREEFGDQTDPEWRSQVKHLLVGAVIVNLGISVFLAVLFNRSILSRLNVLMRNTLLISRQQPLIAQLSGSDEIGVLDRMFHQMNVELALSRQKERAVVENAADVICSLDAQYRFVALNPAAHRIWGYGVEELVGRQMDDILVGDDGQQVLEQVAQSREQHKEVSFETMVKCQNGDRAFMLWTAQWSEPEQIYCCVAHDVTEMKLAQDKVRASEARVRLIIESMPLGLLLTSRGGTIQLTNYSLEKLTSYSSAELLDSTVHRLIPSIDLEELLSTSDEDQSRIGYEQVSREYVLHTRTGEAVPVEVAVTTFSYADSSYLITIFDITERRKIEQLKQDFMDMVSHDLRSPLTSIQGALALIGAGAFAVLSEEGKSTVWRTEQEIERLIGLVNDLLDSEKFRTGKMNLDYALINIEDIISRSVAAVRYLAESKQQKISIVVGPDCSTLAADGRRLIQVIINLVSNAIKFSQREANIEVTAERLEEHVLFQVTDEGPGIGPEDSAVVFEKFYQLPTDANRKVGTGLGLSICKAIVEAHGGTIGVHNGPEQGSVFWFKIPYTTAILETLYEK